MLLGILIAALAVGFTADIFIENSDNLDVTVLGRTFEMRPGWLLVAGVVAAFLLVIGMRCARIGVRRMRGRRTTLREAREVLAARERDAEPAEATRSFDPAPSAT